MDDLRFLIPKSATKAHPVSLKDLKRKLWASLADLHLVPRVPGARERDPGLVWSRASQNLGRSKQPCIQLARLKFELTNQVSAGGKNCTVLTKPEGH